MRYIAFIFLILISLGFTEQQEVIKHPGEFIVYGEPRFPQDPQTMAELKASIEAEGLEIIRPAKHFNGYVVKSDRKLSVLKSQMIASGHVLEENLIYTIPDIPEREGAKGLKCKRPPEDPGEPGGPQPPQEIPWNVLRVQAPEAWAFGVTGRGVLVSVLDTGIDKNHPDLAQNLVAGEDFTRTGDFWDGHGHGTHVAGTVAALDNDIGVAGGAPNASLWVGKVLDDKGAGDVAGIVDGIYGSMVAGADIVSMSFGGGFSQGIEDALADAAAQGLWLVCAAGNESTSDKSWPGASENCIGVAALEQGDRIAGYSNYGDWVDVIMPGSRVPSTVPNDSYATFSGTSMATPLYSAMLALSLESGKPIVSEVLTVRPTPALSFDYPMANGLLTVRP